VATDGQFPIVMRGYERDGVDKAITLLRREIIAANTERNELAAELARLAGSPQTLDNVEPSTPTYSGLGTKLEMVLRTAEEQSTVLLSTSDIEAQRMLTEARLEADSILREVQAKADAIITEAAERAAYMTNAASIDADNLVAIAQRDVKALNEEAIREGTRIRGNASTEAAALRATTQREMAEKKAAFDRDMAETRLVMDKEAHEARADIARLLAEADRAKLDLGAEVTARRHEQEEKLLELHRDALAQNEAYLKMTNEEFSALQKSLTAIKKEHNRLQAEVLKTKGRVELESKEQARHLIDDAEARAKKIISRARSEAQSIVGDAERRLIELQAEREAIAAYIGDLNLAIGSVVRKAGGTTARRTAAAKPAVKPAAVKATANTAAKPAAKPAARTSATKRPAGS